MGGMPALPRDVLRWLTTLNLSQPIKNIKRDFSNGYLVAEIFFQYYPQEIQMHSFDPGTKSAKKRDNWNQLEKFFRKKDFPVLPGEIDSIISCGPDDGIGRLLERMYWFLAHKSHEPLDLPQVEDLWTGVPGSSRTGTTTLDDDIIGEQDFPTAVMQSNLPNDEIEIQTGEIDAHRVDFQENSDNILSYSAGFAHERDAFLRKCKLSSAVLPQKTQSIIVSGFDIHKEFIDDTSDDVKSHSISQAIDNNVGVAYHEMLVREEPTSCLNAVERAREKERSIKKNLNKSGKVAKTKCAPARGSMHEVSNDPGLAFRSPNRQREFKSYTLKDYKLQQPGRYVMLGKLGPTDTEDSHVKREALEKMKEFGRAARSLLINQAQVPKRQKRKPVSTREKALRFASTIPKPKKKDVTKEDNEKARQPVGRLMTELEILELKHQADKQNFEAMRHDLEIFLR